MEVVYFHILNTSHTHRDFFEQFESFSNNLRPVFCICFCIFSTIYITNTYTIMYDHFYHPSSHFHHEWRKWGLIAIDGYSLCSYIQQMQIRLWIWIWIWISSWIRNLLWANRLKYTTRIYYISHSHIIDSHTHILSFL